MLIHGTAEGGGSNGYGMVCQGRSKTRSQRRSKSSQGTMGVHRTRLLRFNERVQVFAVKPPLFAGVQFENRKFPFETQQR
jgi:hypothetical protein